MLRALVGNSTGVSLLKNLGAPVSGVGAAETIVMQAPLSAGQWQTNGVIRIELFGEKSGTTDTYQLTVRVGTAGTTADTAISGLSATTAMVAGTQAAGFIHDIKLLSATSAKRLGPNTNGGHTFSGTGAITAATAITDASTNALFISVGIKSSGATDTVAILSGRILLMAP